MSGWRWPATLIVYYGDICTVAMQVCHGECKPALSRLTSCFMSIDSVQGYVRSIGASGWGGRVVYLII